MAAAARDVLLSAFSLGLWVATRAIDIENMLRSGMPFYDIATAASQRDAPDIASDKMKSPKEEPIEPTSNTTTRFQPDPAESLVQRKIDGGASQLVEKENPISQDQARPGGTAGGPGSGAEKRFDVPAGRAGVRAAGAERPGAVAAAVRDPGARIGRTGSPCGRSTSRRRRPLRLLRHR